MDEFLNLDEELALDGFELRELLEGREAITNALTELRAGENGEQRDLAQLDEETAARFDGLLERGLAVDAEIAERQSEERQQQRAARFQQLQRAGQRQTIPPRGPEGQRGTDPVANPGDRYSLLRAISRRCQNLPVNGYEGEVSQEIAHRTQREPTGFFVPWGLQFRCDLPANADLRGEQRAFDTTAGAGMIPTILMQNRFIDVLRNRLVLAQLGADVIEDVIGDLDLPKKTATTQAEWVGEAVEPTESEMTVGTVPFRPKTLGTWTTITRRMRAQTGPAAENRARADLLDTIRVELDRAAVNGSGVGSEPEGVMQKAGVPTVSIGTDGGALTFAKVVELETQVAAANADLGSLAYLTSAGGRGHLKTTAKDAGSGMFLWERGNTVNGYRAVASEQVPSNLTKGSGTNLTALLFGNWRDLVIALWTGFDMFVDPHTLATTGSVRAGVLIDADINTLRDDSFSKCVDVDPAA